MDVRGRTLTNFRILAIQNFLCLSIKIESGTAGRKDAGIFGTAKLWKPDKTDLVRELMKSTVYSIFVEASRATESDVCEQLAKWALKSVSAYNAQPVAEQ